MSQTFQVTEFHCTRCGKTQQFRVDQESEYAPVFDWKNYQIDGATHELCPDCAAKLSQWLAPDTAVSDIPKILAGQDVAIRAFFPPSNTNWSR